MTEKLDLNSFDAMSKAQEEGIDVHIRHPKTGKPIGFTIKVSGPDSTHQRKAYEVMALKRVEAGVETMTADDRERETIEVTARSIVGWKFADGVTLDGKRPDYSVEEAAKLLSRFAFIRDQVSAVTSSRASFFKG